LVIKQLQALAMVKFDLAEQVPNAR
jgi:hypothetical protein